MNDWKHAITLTICCGICLTVASAASAEFHGITTVIRDDPDTAFLCTQGNGPNIPGPLTVCNVYARFNDPADRLLGVAEADLQVYNGENPDVFFQHPNIFDPTSPPCGFLPILPDLICDTFVTVGVKCGPSPPNSHDGTGIDGDFDFDEFNFNGHVVGGWFNGVPDNGQGDAGNHPNLQVLFLQSSVAQGSSMSGVIHIIWEDGDTGDSFLEHDVPFECAASCGSCPTDTDGDGDTDAMDLAVLLGNWGPVDAGDCQDTDDNGLIDAFDLAVLLGAWGPCL